jgi:hypothetical protein
VARRSRLRPAPARFVPALIAAFLASAVGAQPSVAATQATPWTIVPSATGTYTGVSGLTTNDVWIVGYTYDQPSGRDLPVTQHWDGSRLTAFPAPPASPGYNHFNAVAMSGPSDVWAVGSL